MTTLLVPLHLPVKAVRMMLERELYLREVQSVKVVGRSLVIEHDRMSRENAAELLSCIEGPIII